MRKVLLIGSTGFVGRHIHEQLAEEVSLFVTTREIQKINSNTIYFDYLIPETWVAIEELAPEVIINAAGYGVVKEETYLDLMYDINYRMPTRLIMNLQAASLSPFWLQIGTAFEYDLEKQELKEDSACIPLTHYGISKYLCSHFLLSEKNTVPFLVLRPFAMFGPYESNSKLLPYLINSQKEKRQISLSDGEQQRDYFYVKDLAFFIADIVKSNNKNFQNLVLNIGSGIPRSLKSLAKDLSEVVPEFNPLLWQWGKIPQRDNETPVFYNGSTKAKDFCFHLTPIAQAFQETVDYYFQQQ